MNAAHHDDLVRTAAADPHDGHGHDHGHGMGGEAHGSLAGYLTGFILSAILTAVPFWLVMDMPLPNAQTVGFIVVGLAVVQIVVHMVFFLHMNPRSEGGWTVLALGFTIIVVIITISGTLWVMYHLNTNMMPGHEMSIGDPAGQRGGSADGGTVPGGLGAGMGTTETTDTTPGGAAGTEPN